MTHAATRSRHGSFGLCILPGLSIALLAIACDPGGATAPSGGATPANGPANQSLIDSLEDGDGWIDEVAGRAGPWYTYNDGSAGATQSPRSGDPFVADFAATTHKTDYGVSVGFARTTGGGFTTWGAGFGFDLAHPKTAGKSPYDASAYTGLHLYVKAVVDGPNTPKEQQHVTAISINLLDSDNVPPSGGGVCIDDSKVTPAKKCQDVFSYNIALQGGTKDFSTWQEVKVKWTDFAQAGWGTPAPSGGPDLGALLAIHFQFDKSGKQFDVSVDDIAFTTD